MVLTQNDSTLPHSIIFNFNGAEENILQVHCKYTHIFRNTVWRLLSIIGASLFCWFVIELAVNTNLE